MNFTRSKLYIVFTVFVIMPINGALVTTNPWFILLLVTQIPWFLLRLEDYHPSLEGKP